MNVRTSRDRRPSLRYLKGVRPADVLVLQGPPLLGFAFSASDAGHLDAAALALLVFGNVFLVAHIFMLNDWSGLKEDLADPNKADRVFTARGIGHREFAGLTAACLVASILAFSAAGPVAVSVACGIALLSGLYSLPFFNWKARPLLNSSAHLAGGMLHFLLGYSLGGPIVGRGVAVSAFFALVFTAGHLTQETRDHDGDARNGVRTNAVAFGPRRTFVAGVVLFACAHVLFFVLALRGIVPRPLVAVIGLFAVQLYWSFAAFRAGLTHANVAQLQMRYRLLYAFVGVMIVATLLQDLVRFAR